MRWMIIPTLIIASLFSGNSVADINTHSQAINESGRLRMLTQRMAKAYFLVAMDVQPNKSKAQLTESIATFDENLAQLKSFSANQGIESQLNANISDIDKQWDLYKKQINGVISTNNAASVLLASDQTLAACEALVNKLEQITQRESTKLVNIAGRQRMLSQRIAKIYTAISIGGHQPNYDESLAQAIAEFDTGLKQLLANPSNSHFLLHKLKKVASQWEFSKQGFKALSQGNTAPLVISMTTESILNQMNDITALYEDMSHKLKAS